jgi:hypothetical protein
VLSANALHVKLFTRQFCRILGAGGHVISNEERGLKKLVCKDDLEAEKVFAVRISVGNLFQTVGAA